MNEIIDSRAKPTNEKIGDQVGFRTKIKGERRFTAPQARSLAKQFALSDS